MCCRWITSLIAGFGLFALIAPDATFANTMTITSLWNFASPADSETRFRAALADADPDYRLELLTQVARTHSLRRDFVRAHQLLDEIEPQLENAAVRPRLRYWLERGRTFNSAGDRKAARPLFMQAWELGSQANEQALAIDAAHMIAIVDGGATALEWNRRALQLARQANDPDAKRWEGSLLNNIGVELQRLGQLDDALATLLQAQAVREQSGPPMQLHVARWLVANTLRLLHRYEEALAIQLQLEKQGDATGQPDGYVYEEIAELYEALHRPDDARPYFRRAVQELEKDAHFVGNEGVRLARLKSRAD